MLLRAGLVHIADGEDLLLVVFHHMGSDHVAASLLFAELDAIYRALADGGEPQLPELPIQYADFAEWQRRHFDGGAFDELLEYWTEQLAARPSGSSCRATGRGPSAQSYRGGVEGASRSRPRSLGRCASWRAPTASRCSWC